MDKSLTLTKDNKYRQEHVIPCYAADKEFALRPNAFMDYAQEIAYLAATELGFGYDALNEHHTAWVLSRMSMDFIRMPKWRDTVYLDTWHKGIDGLFFMRDFQMRDKDSDEIIVAASSSWLVIDSETRRLVRGDEVQRRFLMQAQCTENALPENAPKLVMPKDIEKEHVKDHLVCYSDVDFIGHTNNVRYIVWSLDCIPNEITFGRPVKHININFNKETVEGQIVTINRVCIEEGDSLRYMIEGVVDGKAAFISEIIF